MNYESFPKDVHSNEFHALKAEGSLYDDRQDGQESVGANVVDQSSTCDGTGIVPVLESPSCPVRSTTEGNDETGNDKHNNQGDWKKWNIISDICRLVRMEISLFTKQK